MNRKIALIIASGAALTFAVTAIGCTVNKNTADSKTAPVAITTPVPANTNPTQYETTAVTEAKENAAINFAGKYTCGRTTITVDATGSDNVMISVTSSGSAASRATWTMSGKFNPSSNSIEYNNCIKTEQLLDSKGKITEENIIYLDGKGELDFSGSTLRWKDNMDHFADKQIFRFNDSTEEEEKETAPTATPTAKPIHCRHSARQQCPTTGCSPP